MLFPATLHQVDTNPASSCISLFHSCKAYRPCVLALCLLAAGASFSCGAADAKHEIVREVAVERIALAREAGLVEMAAELENDLAETAPRDSIEEASPQPSVLRVPLETQGNPFLDLLVQAAQQELEKPDFSYPIPTPDNPVFLGGGSPRGHLNPRDTAGRMDALLWLYANPASPLRGDPEVLRRFLRRAHAYTDAMLLPGEKRGQQIYDDFAMAPASVALREFAVLYPELLLPSQRRRWDAAMRQAGNAILSHTRNHRSDHARGYANIDVTKAFQLLNFGLYLQDEEMLEEARGLISALEGAILPDGGTHYIWSQNESCGYHEVIPHYLARFHEVSGDTLPLELIKRLEWYGPVSCGPLAEYWTAPSWKQTWNSHLQGLGGGHFVSTVTENPWVRGMISTPSAGNVDLRSWFSLRAALPWFRKGLPAHQLPDGITYPDRNIDGVRAWYGRFSYAATLRDLPVDEPGHATLVGAHFTEPDRSLGAILMGAFPRVQLDENSDEVRSKAWLTSEMSSARVISRNASALAASYELATFGSSRKGALSGWQGRQIWLGLPDRLVAWMDLSRRENARGTFGAEIAFRFGSGGTVGGPTRSLESLAENEWKYGGAILRVLESGECRVETAVVPFRVPRYPISEVLVRTDPVNGGRALVEIRQAESEPATKIEHLESDGLQGFSIKLGNRLFLVAANFSTSEARLGIPGGDEKTSIWISGAQAPVRALSECAVPPGGVAMVVQSPQESDHLAGWKSYQEMIESQKTTSDP